MNESSQPLPANAKTRVKISALGALYVPPKLLTENADLEKMVETSNDWIMARVGIRERHLVEKGVATSRCRSRPRRKRLPSAARAQ